MYLKQINEGLCDFHMTFEGSLNLDSSGNLAKFHNGACKFLHKYIGGMVSFRVGGARLATIHFEHEGLI